MVSIASRTEESGKAFAAEWNIPFQSTSLEACIEAVSAVKDRLDTVVVSRNTETTSG